MKITFAMAVLMVCVTYAYADQTNQFDHMVQMTDTHRAQVESQLGISPLLHRLPQATSYYDDLVDHYEHDLIMGDFIDKGIR